MNEVSAESRKFELPSEMERHLAALSRLYALEGDRDLEELIVNAQVRVREEWDFDNLNGGTYGHALYLTLPEAIFLRSARSIEERQARIREDINRIQNVQSEYISEVFIEMAVEPEVDWRRQSGLLASGRRLVPESATKRIWEEGCFRLFLSHKTDVKKETADLKSGLNLYGISAFVAHEDIHPTKEWQDEIENALDTMDGFLAIMTENFHESDWTDQEVGFALARGVPIIALRLGKDPYGFIGKFQGLTASWYEAPLEVAKLLIPNDRMFAAFLHSIRNCWSFDHGNRLAQLLPAIDRLNDQQIDELVSTYNEGGQAAGSYGFKGSKPGKHGQGLVHHLNRLSSRDFSFDGWRVVEKGE